MKRIFLFITLIFIYSYSTAQTSILQDKSGTSSLALQGGNQVLFNAGDASTTASIGSETSVSGSTTFWDSNLKFKSTNGVSGLFDGTDFKPTVDIGADYGWTIEIGRAHV